MMNFGQLSLWLGIITLCVSSLSYWVAFVKGDGTGDGYLGRAGFVCFTLFVSAAALLLMIAILGHHFEYSYVARYSSTDLPLLYLISAFWAGQEGSFLLWVFLSAWLGIILMVKSGRHESRVMLIYNLNNLFLMILLIKQTPFLTLAFPPADGNGMNLLLQDFWMAIHPPIVFLGYAAFAIPFAFAVSAFWRRNYDEWIGPALPWAVFAFVTLGAGIIIGGFWSYKVLGWGGYWGWDPVENASLLPWLAGMALIHGMILQRARKRFRKTNFLLASFSFLLVIYCTFLTRSGILADFSVHSFTDLGIAGWLVLFMGVFAAISIWMLITRAKNITVERKEELSFFSREFGIMAAMALLLLSCLVTGLGTSAPLITRVMEKTANVSTTFYIKTNLPLAVLILFLLSFVPRMSFGNNKPGLLLKKLPWAIAGALIALAAILWHGIPTIGVLLMVVFAGAATVMNLELAIRLMCKRFSLSSGALVHLGVGLMFIGIAASSIYDHSEKERLFEGASMPVMGYDISLLSPRFLKSEENEKIEIPLRVSKGGNSFLAQLDILQERSPNGQMQQFVHPFIKRGILSDLYIAPVDFETGGTSEPSNHISVKKGESVSIGPYILTFVAYDLPQGMGSGEMQSMQLGARISVSYKNDAPEIILPVLDMSHPDSPGNGVRLPGPEEAFVTLTKVNADDKTITLVYEGAESATREKETASNQEMSVIVDISVKPGMTILWAGTVIMLFGGLVGIVRRRQKHNPGGEIRA